MKRFLSIAVALLACVATMSAWTPSDTDYRLLDLDSVYGQTGLKTLRADNGVIYHTWLRTPQGVTSKDSTFGYYLHLQIFDKDGNALFGKEGVLVSNRATKTYVSDYGVALAPNGDIIIIYTDCRNDPVSRKSIHPYVYRYNQQGQPVWSADGIALHADTTENTLLNNYEMKTSVQVSGDNIYVLFSHTEQYRNENNKKVSVSNFQLNRVTDDGVVAWEKNMLFTTSLAMVKMAPSADGSVFVLYDNDTKGISGRRVNKDGSAVWSEDAVVESELLGNYYMNEPTVLADNKGGIALVYRKLLSFTGYAAYNYLRADGTTLGTGSSMTGSTDGECGSMRAALNGDSLLVAWSYKDSVGYNMYANLVSINAGATYLWPTWPYDFSKGVSYDVSPEWGITPITVIRMNDGWVMFYANSTSWNAANLYVIKIDDYGNRLWSKSICQPDFVANNYSIVNDDRYAYFFIATDKSYDTDKGGGLRVMCIELTDGSDTGVNEVNVAADGVETRYDLWGRQVSADHKGIQIVKCADGTVKKVLVK